MAQESRSNRAQDRFQDWPCLYRDSDRHHQITEGAYAFYRFYDFDFKNSVFAEQAVARGFKDPTTEFRCLLDYVFVWLIEGDATLACPSFEHYLLTVIGIIEGTRYTPGVRQLETADDGSDGYDIFYWGKRPEAADFPHTWDKPEVGYLAAGYGDFPAGELTLSMWLQRHNEPSEYTAGLPIGWEGYNHPSLSRATYERVRSDRARALRHTAKSLNQERKECNS